VNVAEPYFEHCISVSHLFERIYRCILVSPLIERVYITVNVKVCLCCNLKVYFVKVGSSNFGIGPFL